MGHYNTKWTISLVYADDKCKKSHCGLKLAVLDAAAVP